jgi:RNA polymerase sigma-70 factor (ECF subfamily)
MTSSATEPVGALDRDTLADLVEAVARSGDKGAFATLFGYYAPRVKAYLLRLGADHATADELSQEVMVTVWRKAASFDRRQASVSTWLFTIARNRRIDVIRRERRPEFDPDDPLFVPDPEPAPDDVAVRTEQDKRLRAALKTLPNEQLTLVEAAFYGGKSHRDIADETGIPLGTVKSRLRLAFTRLKKALDGDI